MIYPFSTLFMICLLHLLKRACRASVTGSCCSQSFWLLQIHAFAIGSPLHDFLIHVAMPHANLFGALVAFGEVAIGLATLLGLLLRPAAFFSEPA